MSFVVLPPPLRMQGSRAHWDAIVIGSGVGGAVAGSLLAEAGARVLVLEKNPLVGGILASYRRGGFKLDFGSHLVSRGAKGPVGEVLRRLGLARPRLLTHRLPVRSRGIFELAAPAKRSGLWATGLLAARRLGLSRRDTARLGLMMLDLFTMTDWELRRWDNRPLDDFIHRHTDDPRAYFLLGFLASIFFVLPPWDVSAGHALRALRALLVDYSLSYVEGGMDSLAHALLGRVAARGGEIVTDAKVGSIEPRDGLLRVATASGDEYEAPFVACNAAPPELLDLLPHGALPPDFSARLRALRPSGNAHQLKLGLSRRVLDEGCLIGGFSTSGIGLADLDAELMRRTVADLERGKAADPLPVYAPVPSNFDPSVAPPGCQLVLASIYGPSRPDPVDPPAVWKERSLAALARAIPGLEDALLFAELSPIPSVGAWMGRRSNAAIAAAQSPGQVGRDRLPVQTPVPGLYLCGDGAGGDGIGTEAAALSGMQAAAAILRAWGGRAREPTRLVLASAVLLPSKELHHGR